MFHIKNILNVFLVLLFMLKYHYILPREFPCLELILLIYAHSLSGKNLRKLPQTVC